ncbi:cytochrome P450 [Aspergillus clavatus NRRL 1]|uniref:Cytochrome P450 oxidoreductase, putative n=1 Tax=Aspergillus clavatus (strain ATCC 1007 / CBS 513.65 / DSM 816 / NCTC 3887 / NRRL 1 / QM 1276 / 107) TaxID=344612 RepID=A1C5L5_ASPCL|nr:Cytochrome P450 oxidoreductase, putative [Aspergillus clavatus NRRL 1]EAW14983.1 Cytochrome P450 oxidoreductase, putative [Aspergillus clavatus NRRL 1]
MATKSLYLEGRPPEETLCSVDISGLKTLDDLKYRTASIFGVALPKSISFHNESGLLSSMDDISTTVTKIGVHVDDSVIRVPHGPRELPFVGQYFEIHPDHLGNHERLFQKYGNVIKTVVMGRTVYLTNDPRVTEVVFGENEFFTKKTSDFNHPFFWVNDNMALLVGDTGAPAVKLAHKFIPPSMSTAAAQHYMPILQHAIQDSFAVFDQLDDRQAAWNTFQFMFKLSGQMIGKVALGMDLDHFQTVDTQPHQIMHLLGESIRLTRQASLSHPYLVYLPFSAAAIQSTCIADYLKRAVDEDNQKMPKEYILPNLVSILAAGLSTTSSVGSYLLYLLAHHQDMQSRILQELINNNVTPTASWDYKTLMSLPFLDSFVKETLRLHNPAFQPARYAKKDVIVPGAYHLPAGAVVNPVFFSLHRNKDYWENAHRFDPDRWLAADVQKHRTAYTPFAVGPRRCVGFNLANLQLRLMLAMLIFRYKFVDVSPEPVVNDHEYLLDRLVNCYVRAVRRTSWPEKEL